MTPGAGELTCIELVELVTEYVEERLDGRQVARFEAHIAGCDGCRTYLEQMRETIAALGHLPEESISDEARERMIAAFTGWRRGEAP